MATVQSVLGLQIWPGKDLPENIDHSLEKKLWPYVVLWQDFEGDVPVAEKIIPICLSMGLDIDAKDVAVLVE